MEAQMAELSTKARDKLPKSDFAEHSDPAGFAGIITGDIFKSMGNCCNPILVDFTRKKIALHSRVDEAIVTTLLPANLFQTLGPQHKRFPGYRFEPKQR